MQEMRFDPWVGKIPLGEEMATDFSILAWKIPWAEEPGGLQSIASQTVRWTEPLTLTSLVAQLVKNPPTMQETPVRFLGREDSLEKE